MTAENAKALLKGITIQVAAAVRAQLVTPNEALQVLDDDEIIHATDRRYYPDGRSICICERCFWKRMGI